MNSELYFSKEVKLKSHFQFIVTGLVLITLVLGTISFVFAGSFKQDYARAYEAFKSAESRNKRAEIEQVAKTFNALAERNDAGILRANAYFWEAACYYYLKQYLWALQGFERVLIYNPIENKKEDARFKIIQCYVRLKWDKAARWEIERFKKDLWYSRHLKRIPRELRLLGKK